uniref:Uncharacterized protein n=1 Tax=Anopheles culicifacies TaxID=139723 RepID=A0A182MTP4_9DIPT
MSIHYEIIGVKNVPAKSLEMLGRKQRLQHATCTSNGRDSGRSLLHQDKCSRAPILALGLLFCITLYLYFTTTTGTDTTQMIVTIPADDADLPGPKGKPKFSQFTSAW